MFALLLSLLSRGDMRCYISLQEEHHKVATRPKTMFTGTGTGKCGLVEHWWQSPCVAEDLFVTLQAASGTPSLHFQESG